ncbi:hypothetical protein GF367_04700 [Candidatus Woesearchaeota archaeon]|nr:hypothetical protein [Candidatus Woesearchaeota archaeon]
MLRKRRRNPKLENPRDHESHLHRRFEKAPVHDGPDRERPRAHDEE